MPGKKQRFTRSLTSWSSQWLGALHLSRIRRRSSFKSLAMGSLSSTAGSGVLEGWPVFLAGCGSEVGRTIAVGLRVLVCFDVMLAGLYPLPGQGATGQQSGLKSLLLEKPPEPK